MRVAAGLKGPVLVSAGGVRPWVLLLLDEDVGFVRGIETLNITRMMAGLGIVFLLAACAGPGVQDRAGPVYWPKPPDMPRFVHQATLRDASSLQELSAAQRLRLGITGYARKEDPLFSKPYGIAAARGSVVVTDTVRRRGFIFNFWRRKIFPFGHVGEGGVMGKPMGVAMDASQNIYVADVSRHQVLVYDAVGMFLRAVGRPEDMDRPVDVAVTPDGARIYVADAGGIDSQRHRLLIYDAQGRLLSIVGRRGSADGEFNLPTHVAVAPDGTVYVLDSGNFRVQAFDAQGKFLRSWGKAGRDFGDLARPRGLAVDGEGRVYVTDAAYRNFQIFDPEGRLLLSVGGDDLFDKPGHFALPAGIAVDERGFVYVVDQLFRKVEVFRALSEEEARRIMAEDPAYH